jgi:hypothetical protein
LLPGINLLLPLPNAFERLADGQKPSYMKMSPRVAEIRCAKP